MKAFHKVWIGQVDAVLKGQTKRMARLADD